jgi:hypothetical protein
MNFKPTAGNINFTVPSGYDMKVTGSGDFISDVPVNTIGGTSTTTIKGSLVNVSGSTVNVSGSTVKIKSTSNAEVSFSGTTVSITGSVTKIRGADIHLLPKSAGSAQFGIFGQGEVRWAPYNQNYTADSDCMKPFEILTVPVKISQGSAYGSAVINPSSSSYNYVVVGWYGPGVNLVWAAKSSGSWKVTLYTTQTAATDMTCYVHVMGIHQNFVNDKR